MRTIKRGRFKGTHPCNDNAPFSHGAASHTHFSGNTPADGCTGQQNALSVTAFVINIPSFWAKYIRTENNNKQNNYDNPFPTSKAQKASIVAITHSNHLALV